VGAGREAALDPHPCQCRVRPADSAVVSESDQLASASIVESPRSRCRLKTERTPFRAALWQAAARGSEVQTRGQAFSLARDDRNDRLLDRFARRS
jgi:hypothetical protein